MHILQPLRQMATIHIRDHFGLPPNRIFTLVQWQKLQQALQSDWNRKELREEQKGIKRGNYATKTVLLS